MDDWVAVWDTCRRWVKLDGTVLLAIPLGRYRRLERLKALGRKLASRAAGVHLSLTICNFRSQREVIPVPLVRGFMRYR